VERQYANGSCPGYATTHAREERGALGVWREGAVREAAWERRREGREGWRGEERREIREESSSAQPGCPLPPGATARRPGEGGAGAARGGRLACREGRREGRGGRPKEPRDRGCSEPETTTVVGAVAGPTVSETEAVG
jgi:hypothetical protein